MAPKTTGPAVSTQPAIMKPTEEPPAYSQAQPQVYVLMVYSQITAVISVELLAMLTAAAVVSATFFSDYTKAFLFLHKEMLIELPKLLELRWEHYVSPWASRLWCIYCFSPATPAETERKCINTTADFTLSLWTEKWLCGRPPLSVIGLCSRSRHRVRGKSWLVEEITWDWASRLWSRLWGMCCYDVCSPAGAVSAENWIYSKSRNGAFLVSREGESNWPKSLCTISNVLTFVCVCLQEQSQAAAELLRRQEELENKAAELDRREREMQSINVSGG